MVLSKSASLPISMTACICVVGGTRKAALCLVDGTNAFDEYDKQNKRTRRAAFDTMVSMVSDGRVTAPTKVLWWIAPSTFVPFLSPGQYVIMHD
jgi:hypothetical protein